MGLEEKTVKEKLRQHAEGGDRYDFLAIANQRCHMRRFFITRDGYYGIGPELLRNWDRIAILFGGRVPYALRSTGSGQFKFLGECYVHGIMNGEAIEMLKKGQFNKQTFRIL
jgi:hypothetical protein